MSEIVRYPSFVDMHVHFREPGANNSETIASGSRAALYGGYGYVYDMPNNPGRPTHIEDRILEKHNIAMQDSYVFYGAYAGWQPDSDINPQELVFMAPYAAGLKTYHNKTTGNEYDWEVEDFLEAIEVFHKSAPNKPILVHATNIDQVEQYMIDIASELGHHVHICHVNDPDVAHLIASYRHNGSPVSSGVTPHHLVKTSYDEHTHGKFAEMMPPLANQFDSETLLWQLNQGIIDVIETDHAPHTYESKMKAEQNDSDCYGVPGLEAAFPVLNYQVEKDRLSEERLIEAMSTKPAEIMKTPIVANSYSEWEMTTFRIDDESEFVVSGSGWTPYLGNMATGRLVRVVLEGHEVYNERQDGIKPLKGHGINPLIPKIIGLE